MTWHDGGTERLSFELVGEGTRLLLLLHGLGADHRQGLALVDDEVLARFRVVAPDLRAHGRSALDESAEHLTMTRLAADVDALVNDVGAPEGVALVGISLGAAVAIELTTRATFSIRDALLVRPAWGWRPNPSNLAVFPRIAALLDSDGPESGQLRFQDGADYARFAAVSEAAARALLGQFGMSDAVRRAQRLIALPASAPTRPVSRQPPTLVLGNDRDPAHPLPLALSIASDLDARFGVVAPRYDAPAEHARQVAHEIRLMAKDD
jgi:pimeloyl-ACP methyl ester carboxylesterase